MKREHAYKLREMLHKASASLPDEDALEAVELFPLWRIGIDYEADQRIRYGDKLYRCVQAHASQAGWEPPAVPALWTEVAKPGEIPVWKQPTGAQDAYNTGDLVHYPDADGPVYRSTIDNNVWSPEAYPAGWEVVE
jgi:hypothetical protein